MNDKCSTCGNPDHAYCKGSYILGHAKFFGAIIGKCSICNSLIGSAIGHCDADHTPWKKDDGSYHKSLLIQFGPTMDVPIIDLKEEVSE